MTGHCQSTQTIILMLLEREREVTSDSIYMYRLRMNIMKTYMQPTYYTLALQPSVWFNIFNYSNVKKQLMHAEASHISFDMFSMLVQPCACMNMINSNHYHLLSPFNSQLTLMFSNVALLLMQTSVFGAT